MLLEKLFQTILSVIKEFCPNSTCYQRIHSQQYLMLTENSFQTLLIPSKKKVNENVFSNSTFRNGLDYNTKWYYSYIRQFTFSLGVFLTEPQV